MTDDREEFTADQFGQEERRTKKRPKGTLPYLPGREAKLGDLRDWLTRAFEPPSGYTFDGFERHGRRLSDPAWLVLRAPTGGEVRFRFPEQRGLARPANLRASVLSITDGLCRMSSGITGPEKEDVWAALCLAAHVVAHQDEVEEFRDQLDIFYRAAETEGRYTLEPSGRYDALVALQAHGTFERRHARQMVDDINEQHWDRRPLRVIDAVTGLVRVRVGELATYLRHVIGLSLGNGVLDGRMSEIGAVRERFEVRNGGSHPHMSFYRLPAEDESEAEK